MPNWKLMQLVEKKGKRILVPFAGLSFDRTRFKRLLQAAADSKNSKPVFSGYFVRGSGTTFNNANPPQSGNIEYGHCQALHNEEATVAALASIKNSAEFEGFPAIAIVAGKGKGTLGNFTMPCGNCRDILRDTLGPDCIILSGTEDGGIALVMKLSDALFENYEPISAFDVWGTVRRSDEIFHNPYNNPNIHPLRNYGVCVLTGKNGFSKKIYGASFVHADFHPIYPIESVSLQMWLRREFRVKMVAIVAEGDGTFPPDVMYRDRQRLLEMMVEDELLSEQKNDSYIYLFTHNRRAVTGAWRTTAKEWLPFPFSPHNFGEKFLRQYKKYLKEKYRRE